MFIMGVLQHDWERCRVVRSHKSSVTRCDFVFGIPWASKRCVLKPLQFEFGLNVRMRSATNANVDLELDRARMDYDPLSIAAVLRE
jgi:hypothetical protein